MKESSSLRWIAFVRPAVGLLLFIYLYQICRNSLKIYNDRAVRLLRKEC